MPVIALTAAVSGLTRYIWASVVPLLPSKLRLNVLKEIPSLLGACPIPIQGPHAHSRTLAPASIMSANAPFWASILNTCFDPGEIVRLTFSLTVLPFKIFATFIISV